MTDMRHSRLHLNMRITGIHLRQEVGINMSSHRYMPLVVGHAQSLEVIHLCRIIILEVYRVIDMPELVGIEESKLQWKFMMEHYIIIHLNTLIFFLIHC